MMKMDSNLGYSYHLPTAGWNLKVRNALSQCSDIFSEFNKYIAPAYHHDRCERYKKFNIFFVYQLFKLRFNIIVFIAIKFYKIGTFHLFFRSVQMRLYSMHKREFVMVFVAFFACFGLAVFIGLAGINCCNKIIFEIE